MKDVCALVPLNNQSNHHSTSCTSKAVENKFLLLQTVKYPIEDPCAVQQPFDDGSPLQNPEKRSKNIQMGIKGPHAPKAVPKFNWEREKLCAVTDDEKG